jgi:hypothetical protein
MIPVTLVGVGHCLTFSRFLGSGLIPDSSRRYPSMVTEGLANSHFPGWSLSLARDRAVNTFSSTSR